MLLLTDKTNKGYIKQLLHGMWPICKVSTNPTYQTNIRCPDRLKLLHLTRPDRSELVLVSKPVPCCQTRRLTRLANTAEKKVSGRVDKPVYTAYNGEVGLFPQSALDGQGRGFSNDKTGVGVVGGVGY